MVDWVAETGQQLIQLLPVNDTTTSKTWCDSYPYSAISNYALHPIYLGCTDFPLKDVKRYKQFMKEGMRLNELPQMDYEGVLALKEGYARELYKQEGQAVLASEVFQSFFAQNEAWLFPYACYCFLRDHEKSADFTCWGAYQHYNEANLRRLVKEGRRRKR